MDTIKVGHGCRAKAKKLSSISFRGAFLLAAGGYFLTRYPSMLDKVSSHFPRSPFTHPSPTSAHLLSTLIFPLFLFLLSTHRLVLFAPVPLPSAIRPPSRVSSGGFRWRVFRRSRVTTSYDCRNEFYVFADSFIAAGLDDRVNRRRTSFFPSSFNPSARRIDGYRKKNLATGTANDRKATRANSVFRFSFGSILN